MPKLSDVVTTLRVQGKTFNKPEWWSSAHKLKREVKVQQYLESIKANSNLRTSYRVTPLNTLSADEYAARCKDDCALENDGDLAPWNPVFRKFKTIILYKKQ